jgi:nondiscriminating glutamyl-tRNA synthetase
LSKRHGATAVSQYREEGFLPEALLNYLVLLGWASPSGEEILPVEKIIEGFTLTAISKSAPVHNRKKLEWLNSHYIRDKRDEELADLLLPYLQKAGIASERIDRGQLAQIAGILKDNLVVLSDVNQYLGIFYDETLSIDERAKTILLDPTHRETVHSILSFLENPSDVKEDRPMLTQLEEKTGRKGKTLYAPLRAAVTGKVKGPELVRTLPLLGRERIIRRLKAALELS